MSDKSSTRKLNQLDDCRNAINKEKSLKKTMGCKSIIFLLLKQKCHFLIP